MVHICRGRSEQTSVCFVFLCSSCGAAPMSDFPTQRAPVSTGSWLLTKTWLRAAPESKIHSAAFLQRRILKYSDGNPGVCVAVPCPLGACAQSLRCACESLPNGLPSPPATTGTPCSLPHLSHAPSRTTPSPLGCIVALMPCQSDATWLPSPCDPNVRGLSVRSLYYVPAPAWVRQLKHLEN